MEECRQKGSVVPFHLRDLTSSSAQGARPGAAQAPTEQDCDGRRTGGQPGPWAPSRAGLGVPSVGGRRRRAGACHPASELCVPRPHREGNTGQTGSQPAQRQPPSSVLSGPRSTQGWDLSDSRAAAAATVVTAEPPTLSLAAASGRSWKTHPLHPPVTPQARLPKKDTRAVGVTWGLFRAAAGGPLGPGPAQGAGARSILAWGQGIL